LVQFLCGPSGHRGTVQTEKTPQSTDKCVMVSIKQYIVGNLQIAHYFLYFSLAFCQEKRYTLTGNKNLQKEEVFRSLA